MLYTTNFRFISYIAKFFLNLFSHAIYKVQRSFHSKVSPPQFLWSLKGCDDYHIALIKAINK